MPCLRSAGLVAAGFEGGDFGVHVGEDGGDGGLFGIGWNGKVSLAMFVLLMPETFVPTA